MCERGRLQIWLPTTGVPPAPPRTHSALQLARQLTLFVRYTMCDVWFWKAHEDGTLAHAQTPHGGSVPLAPSEWMRADYNRLRAHSTPPWSEHTACPFRVHVRCVVLDVGDVYNRHAGCTRVKFCLSPY